MRQANFLQSYYLAPSILTQTKMDEKAPYVYNTPAFNSPIMAASRASVRAVVALFILFTVAFYSWRSWTLSSPLSLQLQPSPPIPESSPVDQKALVPLEAHIISKCPDTRVSPPVMSAKRKGTCEAVVLIYFS